MGCLCKMSTPFLISNNMKVNFNNKTYTLKYSFRALMIYENITNHSFNPKGITDVVIFFYSVVVASAKDTNLSFDDFIEWLDENPTSINEFSAWLTDVFAQQASLVNTNINVEEQGEVDEKN